MGQYVTPRGVVLTLGDAAARAVGYRPADEQSEKKKPTRRKATAKKADEQSADDE